MTMRLLMLIGFILAYALLPAQKHDYVWRHGTHYPSKKDSAFTMDFRRFPPIIEPTRSTVEFSNSGINIADPEGNTAFFSDGCSLFSTNGSVIQGGEVLNPGEIFDFYCSPPYGYYPIVQGMFALSLQPNIYHIFHQKVITKGLPNYCWHPELLHSTIDMTQNGGLGKVTKSGVELFKGCPQVLCANKHANGRDWWLFFGSNEDDVFYRFLLTPDTILGPWQQQIDHPGRDSFAYAVSWSEFSPDGQRFLNAHHRKGIAVYDFDRCTGLLSNTRFVPMVSIGSILIYGAFFSPNGQFLYATTSGPEKIHQFDLTAADLVASKTMLAEWDGERDEYNHPIDFNYIQHGPDGKMYVWSGTRHLHVIDNPDRKGVSCGLRRKVIQLPFPAFFANFYYPHYRLGPLDNSPCDTLGLNNLPHAEYRYDLVDSTQALARQFTDVSWYQPTAWRWDFGDPASGSNTSTEQNPVHTFSKSGIYTVCLIASNLYAADTICKQVAVGVSSLPALPALPQAQVLPNPVKDALTVRLPALLPGHPLRFALADALGRTLREVALSDFETQVDVSGLPPGLYFWRMSVRGEVVQAGKVVKVQ
jgi:hypothetical protein